MSRRINKLEELSVNTTYRCCNHDIAFGSEWFTPVEIDLSKRSIVFEDATREKNKVIFKDSVQEDQFFNFNNMHPVR